MALMKLIKKKEYEHSPTLNTVIMVEKTLDSMNESIITIAGLKKFFQNKLIIIL